MADLNTVRDAIYDRVVELLEATEVGADFVIPDYLEADHVYARDTPTLDPQRDGLPAVVVAPTPDAPMRQRRTASVIHTGFPISIQLVDAQNHELDKESIAWREAARSTLQANLCGRQLPGVPTCYHVMMDQDTVLSGQAYREANLWWVGITLIVWCSRSY